MKVFFVLRFFLAQIEDEALRPERVRNYPKKVEPEARALIPVEGIVDLSSSSAIREP